jgi:predicted dehydrogenase
MAKVLIIGLGSIGRRHLRNTRTLLPNSEIAVLRQHNTEKQEVPEFSDKLFFRLQDALDFHPDVTIIASPASSHIENAVHMLKNGSHLFIEKPLAIDGEQNKQIEELIKRKETLNQFVMIGYVLRFQPILSYIKSILDEGIVGQVYSARIEVGQYLPSWRPESDYRHGVSAQKNLGGGVLLELSHEIDYAKWLFGTPTSIFCSHNKLSPLEIDVEDSACLIFEYTGEKKRRVVINLDFLQQTPSMNIEVVGHKGKLTADLITESITISDEDAKPVHVQAPKLKEGNEMYLRQFDFLFEKSISSYKSIFDDSSSYNQYVTINSAYETLKIIELARLSNLEGTRISLEHL